MRMLLIPVLAMVILSAGCGANVDLAAVPQAAAECEPPTAFDLVPEARMLPGRVCQDCHVAGGEASDHVWTVAGTVFNDPNSQCDTGGVEGATVDILDATNTVILSMTTNRAGNFYSAEPRDFSLTRARVTYNGTMREMQDLQATTACAVCHVPGGLPPGRVYIETN